MLKPLNTKRNRDLKLLDYQGEVMFVKYDIVYFKLKGDTEEILLQCGRGFFERNFKTDSPLVDLDDKVDNQVLRKFTDYVTLKKI